MRLVVTGASGFIGRHAVELAVRRGDEVHALCRSLPSDRIRGAQYHQADLLDDRAGARELLKHIQPSHLLHLAWYATPGLYWRSPENFRWVAASLDLADAFVAAGGHRLVVAGTCAEYDWSEKPPFQEILTATRPCTPYGIAKNELRALLESWTSLTGTSFAWGRIFFTYGPGEPDSRLVASVTRSLLRKETALCTNGVQQRDFLEVEDVAGALIALADSTVSGPVNIASGHAVAVRDVVMEIGRQTGRPDLIALGATPARDEPPVILADVARLRDELAWTQQRDISAGIARAIDWWQSRLA